MLLLHKKRDLGKALIGYFLPEGLLEHFKITNVDELGEVSTKRKIGLSSRIRGDKYHTKRL